MLSSEKSRSPSHQGWAKCPSVLLEPPGSSFISLRGQCLVCGLLCFSFCSVSPSRARTKSALFSALSPVPSTGLLGISPLVPFCGELNLVRSGFYVATAFSLLSYSQAQEPMHLIPHPPHSGQVLKAGEGGGRRKVRQRWLCKG